MYTCRLEYNGIVKDFGNFNDPRSALEFISHDEMLIIIQYLCCRLDYQLGELHLIEPSYIKVYDLKQGRYCDNFDF